MSDYLSRQLAARSAALNRAEHVEEEETEEEDDDEEEEGLSGDDDDLTEEEEEEVPEVDVEEHSFKPPPPPDPLDAFKVSAVPWVYPRVKTALPPSELTVTHVNQAWDLYERRGVEGSFNETQTSEEWLRNHGIAALKLSLRNLVDKGHIDKPKLVKETGKMTQHMKFDSFTINEFEYRLNMGIEMYTKRIKWLLNGSKRMFGLIKGSRVAVCIDSSDANMNFGRQSSFQQALLHLLDEQLSKKKGSYLVSFGTDISPLWPATRDTNVRTLEEAKVWVSNMRGAGGCNVLQVLKHVMQLRDVDAVVLILGSVPDQNTQVVSDYVEQLGVGKERPIHCVAYDCANHQVNMSLQQIAEASEGRYHCYTSTCEDQIYTGSDVSCLLDEIKKAQEIINKIKEMRQGMMGNALVSIMEEVSQEVEKLPQSRFLPRPPGHELPLNIEEVNFQVLTSVAWMKKHGLKARKLDLYQVLAPNAYVYKEEFIPVIRRTVQSQVNERAMTQFQWHDGSLRNVHVDLTQLFEYQKQLGAVVRLYEKRIDWLSSGSRRIFGTVTGKNVVLLIDLSVSNTEYLVHVQHSLRLLMEQQFANKEYFNVIGFGSEAKAWKPTMVPATPDNLQKAWFWILSLECAGSRNFLSAFKLAVENDEEIKHGLQVEGVYLLTSGVPDQPIEVLTGYVEASCSGRPCALHTILFNVDDYNNCGPIPGRYANITRTADSLRTLAHATAGRFHWLRETGIIESDDIKCVALEMEKAINFSRKCALLVEKIKRKYKLPERYREQEALTYPEDEDDAPLKALPPPRDTALSHSRKLLNHPEERLLSRPQSAKAGDTKASTTVRSRPQTGRDPMRMARTRTKASTESFYVEGKKKNETGAVYKRYPKPKSVRKTIPTPVINDTEDVMTTKEWLRVYSLSRLKLDLDRLISGPDTKHKEGEIKSLKSKVEAKYCSIFPLVNVKGVMKHLQLLPSELAQYDTVVQKVVRRYLRRLQWLLSGSRRVFGTVVHKRCCILIDTSGSMAPHLEELKKELASLVWDQLHRVGARFNLIRFSDFCEQWQPSIVPATEDNCHLAVQWGAGLSAHGNTATLEAIQMALSDPDVEAIYLLSDGKPDKSTAAIVREVARLNEDRHVPVNTIAFNTHDVSASDFLQLLARETHGRYHRVQRDMETHAAIHRLLSEGFLNHEIPRLPDLDGDDLSLLQKEITKGRRFITQSRAYRQLYPKHHQTDVPEAQEKTQTKKKGPANFVVGKSDATDNWLYKKYENTRKTTTC